MLNNVYDCFSEKERSLGCWEALSRRLCWQKGIWDSRVPWRSSRTRPEFICNKITIIEVSNCLEIALLPLKKKKISKIVHRNSWAKLNCELKWWSKPSKVIRKHLRLLYIYTYIICSLSSPISHLSVSFWLLTVMSAHPS